MLFCSFTETISENKEKHFARVTLRRHGALVRLKTSGHLVCCCRSAGRLPRYLSCVLLQNPGANTDFIEVKNCKTQKQKQSKLMSPTRLVVTKNPHHGWQKGVFSMTSSTTLKFMIRLSLLCIIIWKENSSDTKRRNIHLIQNLKSCIYMCGDQASSNQGILVSRKIQNCIANQWGELILCGGANCLIDLIS